MNALLVEPKVSHGWGHNNQYVGLLRVGRWLVATGHNVAYVNYPMMPDFVPDEIFVTSMYTYSYRDVWDAVQYYKTIYPLAIVHLGGIYASICPEHAKGSGADDIMIGRHPQAMEYPPDPSLLPVRPDFSYLFSSYGCNRACTFCASKLLNKTVELVEPDKVIEEIEFLISKGFKTIWFGDDNILFDAENHINVICEKLLQKKIKAKYKVPGGMAAIDFTMETALLMKRAGFFEVSFGLESISADVRKKMGRANNSSEEDLLRAMDIVEKAGFKRWETSVFFVIGLPYQTIEDMLGTLNFVIGTGALVHPHRLTPIPNTVDWKRMGLENVDYADLYYKNFLADQTNFTSEDLDAIYKIARYNSIGQMYSAGFNPFRSKNRVSKLWVESRECSTKT